MDFKIVFEIEIDICVEWEIKIIISVLKIYLRMFLGLFMMY